MKAVPRSSQNTVEFTSSFPFSQHSLIPCWLPTKSPWLNRIEPKWVHGKRAIVEPARLLTAKELKQRVCDYFGCEQIELLKQKVS